MAEPKVILTETDVKKVLNDVTKEVYSHRPTRFCISLKASVYEVPVLRVEYECNVFHQEEEVD